MAEKIVSPGVFTKEIDASFLPAAIGNIGAAIVGPTVKGPALIPTVVTSYSEFQSKFGDTFKSGSSNYQYLTSHAAKEYLKHSGKLTVVRILDGDFGGAYSSVPTGSGNWYTGSIAEDATVAVSTLATSFKLHTHGDGAIMNNVWKPDTAASYNLATGSGGILLSGSADNIRWEITGTNHNKGTFSLLVRRGDDTAKRKQILETWNNLSLDPNQPNYIAKVIHLNILT